VLNVTGPALRQVQRRTISLLFAVQSVAGAGYIASVVAGSLLAAQLTGVKTWAGAPSALAVIGAAAASVPLSTLMTRIGRRRGLALGYIVGAAGALVVAIAASIGSFPLVIPGMFLLGVGSCSNLLGRYAAADVYERPRRGAAISLVVWGGTVGSVLGPNLLEPTGVFAAGLNLPVLTGPYLLGFAGFVAAAALVSLLLRPDPLDVAASLAARDDDGRPRAAVRALPGLLRLPAVQVALASLVIAQVVMVMIMSMTPLHLQGHDHGLVIVGLVISGHTFGMFAFSPITGWLSDRLGRLTVIVAGCAIIIGSTVLGMAAPGQSHQAVMLALFLLGVGWNFCFVAGSTLLNDPLRPGETVRVQGVSDLMVGVASASANLTSGLIMELRGYAFLSLIGALLTLIPLAVVIWNWAGLRVRARVETATD